MTNNNIEEVCINDNTSMRDTVQSFQCSWSQVHTAQCNRSRGYSFGMEDSRVLYVTENDMTPLVQYSIIHVNDHSVQ